MAKSIRIEYLARIEGESALTIHFDGERATSAELNIFEPPRFFEALLRGRTFEEAPDITARICGICPVAYQMSACNAVENALGLMVTPALRKLRRLLYCGEWIGSHALHIFMLHAPDFLKCASAIEVAKSYPDFVKDGLRIKKVGNALVAAIAGREIHPINVRIGGFYSAPQKTALDALLPELEWAILAMERHLRWFATFDFPDFERQREYVALRHSDEYAICEGRIVSNQGLDIDAADYETHFEETQVPHSTALRSTLRARGSYLCGPLSRINLNFDKLGSRAAQAADAIGFAVPCHNPFRSILARSLEVIQALDDARLLIKNYAPPDPCFIASERRAAKGYGCSEAPRGLLYHRYAMAADGMIDDAKIVPPTSQNQLSIEEDLLELGTHLASLPDAAAALLAEHAVRNHDPCISCSTHFLKLKLVGAPVCPSAS